MRAAICIPYRPGRPDHDRIWPVVRDHYAQMGLRIVIGDNPGDFSIAQARNEGARLAGDWDVIVFEDSDRVSPIDNLLRAIAHAHTTDRLTVAYDHYYSMSPAGHQMGLDSEVPIGNADREDRWIGESYQTTPVYGPGGLTAVPRAEWDRVGGYDERFIGWAPEDAAFLILAGEFDRLAGPAYHFWHPDSSVLPPGEPWPEYRDRLVEMQARGAFTQHLVDEGRDLHDFGGWTM